MPTRSIAYPVIDIFAGPGGLGEGFAAFNGGGKKPRFLGAVAIERDEFSHQTLLLRHFIRCFRDGIPDDYYEYLERRIELKELYRRFPAQHAEAAASAVRISLGPENHNQVRKLINQKLSDCRKWVLVGGPPCQAYSLVGRSRMMGNPDFENDERHFLYREYLKIIVDHRPPVFVMENVKGLLSATIDGVPVINKIVSDLSRPKMALRDAPNGLAYRLYSLSEQETPEHEVDPRLFLVRSEEYGVPQARHRMFIVGIRRDVDVRPRQLRPHTAPTVRETIAGLPAIRSSLSRGGDSFAGWLKEISELQSLNIAPQLNGAPYAKAVLSGIKLHLKKDADRPQEQSSLRYPRRRSDRHAALSAMFDPRLKVLTGHESRGHMASDLRRYLYASVFAEVTGRSPKLADFPKALLPDHRNVDLGRTGKMFSDRFRVQLPDEVSTTITSHISKDGHYFIHYDPLQCRSLSVREAARLQTFPDNYRFEGPRTSQYHQVGNAVPPYLAGQIAEIVAEVLDAMKDGS